MPGWGWAIVIVAGVVVVARGDVAGVGRASDAGVA